MDKFKKLELQYIIENIELDLNFQDLTEEEIEEKENELKIAKEKLKQLNS